MPTKISKMEEYPKEVLDKFLKYHNEKDLLCKCGEFKRIKTARSVFIVDYYCGDKKCHKSYGKLRPEHSAYMKNLAASGKNDKFSSTLMKRGELKNPKVNSIEFIKTKLMNKGIDIKGFSESDIRFRNSKYESEKQFSSEYISKAIIKFINKHNLHAEFGNPTFESLLALPIDSLLNIRYRMASWHHFLYCSKRCSKNYKRDTCTNLKFNLRGLTLVKTKSSYESNHIRFFEENKIPWDYEPFRIVWNEENGATYTPDFVFVYGEQKFILETKGFLSEQYRNEYLTTRINSAFDYAKNNEYSGMIISFNSSPSNIEELINQTMKEKY